MQFTQVAKVHTRSLEAPGTCDLSLQCANSAWSRFRGLMLAPPLQTEPQTQALLITRCPSVHGFFMRYPIDVVYLAKAEEGLPDSPRHYTVTHTTTLRPWRVSYGKSHTVVTQSGSQTKHSAHALELPAGSIKRLHISVGDTVEVTP